jgi:hypothetical protein
MQMVFDRGLSRTVALAFCLFFGVCLLGLAGPPAQAQSRDTLVFGAANTCEKLRNFIARFPDSRHFAEARAAMRTRRCPDPEAAAAAARAELEAAKRREEDLNRQIAAEKAARKKAEDDARMAGVTKTTPAPGIGAETDNGPFGLGRLHPEVRAVVVRARAAERSAEAAGVRARAAALRAEDAAARARRGDPGTRAFTQSDGARYETEWSNNARNGLGVRVEVPPSRFVGERYAGEWKNDFYHGVGVYTFSRGPENTNGSLRFEGEYLNDFREGYAMYFWSNGSRYAGQYQRGNRNGPGVLRWGDGRRDEGIFVGTQFEGYGVLWNTAGQVERQGVWRAGQLQQPLTR